MHLSVARPSIALLAATIVVSGCNDATGPLAELPTIDGDLAAVNGVLASPLVRSAAGVFSPQLTAPAPGGPLIPDSLRGRTFTWSCASSSYGVASDTGAPAAGIRFLLYQRVESGAIACPPVAIGRYDFLDASTAGTNAIRAVATDLAGDSLVAYTLTSLANPPRASSGAGYVGDGVRRLDLQVVSNDSLPWVPKVDWSIALEGADVRESLADTIAQGVDTYSRQVDFTVRHGSLTAELTGGYGWFNTLESWNETVRLNAVPFATVSGNSTPPVITPVYPMMRFTSSQRQMVLDLVNAPGTLESVLGGLLNVPKRLLGV